MKRTAAKKNANHTCGAWPACAPPCAAWRTLSDEQRAYHDRIAQAQARISSPGHDVAPALGAIHGARPTGIDADVSKGEPKNNWKTDAENIGPFAVQPLWEDDVPTCSEACGQHDGKRCGVLGRRPGRLCEPVVAGMGRLLSKVGK